MAPGRISLDDQEVVTSRGLSAYAQAGEFRSVALRPEAVAIGRNGARSAISCAGNDRGSGLSWARSFASACGSGKSAIHF